jgi:16S rRNA (guanine966-N2)-methyltransferase
LPNAAGLRPTGDRIRETLFNWLQADIPGARCLDLFAGSGVLGLEAASRGAADVVLVEQNQQVCEQLRESIASLGAADVTLVECAALAYLGGPPLPFDIVFLDPPFAENHLPTVSNALQDGGWLAPRAKIYVEQIVGAHSDLPGWSLLKEKVQGNVRFALYAAN